MTNLVFVLAEVMDKEPTLTALWLRGFTFGLIGLLAALWRRWAAWLLLAVALVFCYAILSELFDPFVGPAIRREAGLAYFGGAIGAGLFSLALPLLGLFIRGLREPAAPECST